MSDFLAQMTMASDRKRPRTFVEDMQDAAASNAPIGDVLKQAGSSFVQGATGVVKAGVHILDRMLPLSDEQRAAVPATDEALFSPIEPEGVPGQETRLPAQIAGMAGQTLAMAPAALAGAPGLAVVGGAVGGEMGAEDAERAGAGPQDTVLNALAGTFIGAATALGPAKALTRFGINPSSAEGGLVRGILESGAVGGAQSVGTDLAAKATFDPARKIDLGRALEAALSMGVVGGASHGFAKLMDVAAATRTKGQGVDSAPAVDLTGKSGTIPEQGGLPEAAPDQVADVGKGIEPDNMQSASTSEAARVVSSPPEVVAPLQDAQNVDAVVSTARDAGTAGTLETPIAEEPQASTTTPPSPRSEPVEPARAETEPTTHELPPATELVPDLATLDRVGPERAVALKHESTEAMREALQADPRTGRAPKKDVEIHARALAELKADPHAGTRLVDELSASGRMPTDEEGMLLALELNRRRNAAEAAPDGPERDAASKAFQAAADVTDRLGSEAGAAFRMRQALIRADYSYAGTERRFTKAKGSPLTEEEKAGVADRTARLAKLEDDVAALKKGQAEEGARKAAEEAFARQKREVDKPIQRAARTRARGERRAQIDRRLGEIFDKFKRQTARANIDPEQVADLVEAAKLLIERGLTKFADFAEHVVAQTGEHVRPHLESAWNKAVAEHRDELAAPAIERVKAGENPSRYLRAVERHFVESGMTDREKVLDAVHSLVKEHMTREQVRDALSGYGQYRAASKEPVDVQIRQNHQEMQKLAQIEALEKRMAPLKTGFERGEPSDEYRRLAAKVADLQKQAGIKVVDPATALKTAEKSRETYLRNKITDLQHEIATGKLEARTKGEPPTNDKIKALEADLATTREQHDALFAKPEKSAEAKKEEALTERLREIDAKIAKGDTSTRPGKATVDTAAVAKLRAEIDAKNEQLARMRAAEKPSPENPEAKRIQAQIDALTNRIETGVRRGAKQGPDTEQVAKLKERREALRAQITEAEKAGRPDPVLKRLGRQVEELTKRIEAGDTSAQRSAKQGPDTEPVARMKAQRQALADRLAEMRRNEKPGAPNPEADNLRRQIADLRDQVASGEIKARASKQGPDTAEVAALKSEREVLRKQQAEMRAEAKPEPTPEEIKARKIATQLAATERAIKATQDQIANWDVQKKAGQPGPTSPELEAARARLKAEQATLEELRAIANPKATPEERATKARLAQLARDTERLQARASYGDYAPRTHTPRVYTDPRVAVAEATRERARRQLDMQARRYELANRTTSEKIQDKIVKYRRAFVLSSPSTLAKLTAAGIERMVFTPTEEAIGAGIGKAIPGVAAKAAREGGINLHAEGRALAQGFTRGLDDAMQTLKTGKSDLDLVNGNPREHLDHDWLDFLGSLHGALKSPTKRNEFTRSLAKRSEWALRNGLDVNNQVVQARLAADAFKDANRSIFMQDNRVVDAYKRAISALEQPNKATGKPSTAGKIAATTAKVFLPIVKVPTNVVAETMQYALGIVPGGVKLSKAYAKGIENLKPEEADEIMRHLKKGSVGAATVLLGYFGAGSIGGYYQPGKRDEKDVNFGSIRVFGTDVPSLLVHNPLLECLQIGATLRRVSDHKIKGEEQGLDAGLGAAAFGLLEQVPFVREMEDVGRALEPGRGGSFVSQTAADLAVPQGVSWLARQLDKDAQGNPVKRKPQGIWENIMERIPGARNNLPVKR